MFLRTNFTDAFVYGINYIKHKGIFVNEMHCKLKKIILAIKV